MHQLVYVSPCHMATYYPLPFEDNKEAMKAICDIFNKQLKKVNPNEPGRFTIMTDIGVKVKSGIDFNLVVMSIGKEALDASIAKANKELNERCSE